MASNCDNTQKMGFVGQDEWGDINSVRFKRKFRWKFIIPDISASGVNSLPPSRSARPNLSFSEIRAEHLNETIYYPGKPDWRTINLVLYDIVKPNENPIFTWIKRAYDPFSCSEWFPSCDDPSLKAIANLQLYDGCGCLIEEWQFEHVWPQSVEFGDLEMNNSEIVMVDVTLRYDRAFILKPVKLAPINFSSSTQTCDPEAPCPFTPICPGDTAPAKKTTTTNTNTTTNTSNNPGGYDNPVSTLFPDPADNPLFNPGGYNLASIESDKPKFSMLW